MKRLKITHLIILFLVLVMSSCLTTEKKEYIFKFTGQNSGTLTIRYINMLSSSDDSTDISKQDFKELLDNYINGDKIKEEYPTATNIRKQLYEINGQLYAEIFMDFQNLEAARLYQHDANSPFMLCLTTEKDTEHFVESNGSYGGKIMPVVFWDKDLKELHLTTSITQPDQSTKSLAGPYREWKKQQESTK
jgi:hypothetical protein